MNRFCGLGRITATPELKVLENGGYVCPFTIAINRKFRNQDDEYEADFINCVAFNKTAELIGEYIKKGDLLGVEGRVQTRTYTNKDDRTVYVTEVIVDQITFAAARKEKDVETVEPLKQGVYKETDPFEEEENKIPFYPF